MSKVLIITADKCDDSELLYPYYRLIEEGYDVDIASFEKGTVSAKYHFTIDANKSFKELNGDDYVALLLPGGTAPEKIRQNEDVKQIVKEFFDLNKPVASICHGQQILISAKVLEGIKATCYPGIKDDILNSGAIYEDAPMVCDRNLVTSRRPQDLPYFMKEFLKLIKNRVGK